MFLYEYLIFLQCRIRSVWDKDKDPFFPIPEPGYGNILDVTDPAGHKSENLFFQRIPYSWQCCGSGSVVFRVGIQDPDLQHIGIRCFSRLDPGSGSVKHSDPLFSKTGSRIRICNTFGSVVFRNWIQDPDLQHIRILCFPRLDPGSGSATLMLEIRILFFQKQLDSICFTLSPDSWVNPHRSILGQKYQIRSCHKSICTVNQGWHGVVIGEGVGCGSDGWWGV